MPYPCYRIDASALDRDRREKVYEMLSDWADILDIDFSHPGIYEAVFNKADISILENPVFSGCVVTSITQSDT